MRGPGVNGRGPGKGRFTPCCFYSYIYVVHDLDQSYHVDFYIVIHFVTK